MDILAGTQVKIPVELGFFDITRQIFIPVMYKYEGLCYEMIMNIIISTTHFLSILDIITANYVIYVSLPQYLYVSVLKIT